MVPNPNITTPVKQNVNVLVYPSTINYVL